MRSGTFHAFGRIPLDDAIIGFLCELDFEEPLPRERLLKCIWDSRYGHDAKRPVLAGNAATVLTRIAPSALSDGDLRRVSITKADMRFADLSGASFAEASFEDVDLRCATLPPRGVDRALHFRARVHLVAVATRSMAAEDIVRVLNDSVSSSTSASPPSPRSRSRSADNLLHRIDVLEQRDLLCAYADTTVDSAEALFEALDRCQRDARVIDAWLYETSDQPQKMRWPSLHERLRTMITASSARP